MHNEGNEEEYLQRGVNISAWGSSGGSPQAANVVFVEQATNDEQEIAQIMMARLAEVQPELPQPNENHDFVFDESAGFI